MQDFNYRAKLLQNKINYENSLLKGKIIKVYTNIQNKRNTQSFIIKSLENKTNAHRNTLC
jgi:hypothetical protein